MSDDLVIDAAGLGKEYRIGLKARQHDTVRDLLVDRLGGLLRGRRGHGAGTFWALREAAFQIRRGENVGIIGLNGAGKSTLLKILSRITTPTTGRVRIVGRVGALLEVGTGFHPELTGRENVFLYGAILGMTKEEVRRKFGAIADFSGIEQFLDTPLKRYSSGMYVRLAFAVAAHLEPEILLLDEVLAVGDLAFQRKCIDFAKRLQQQEATILFVSHNMFSIKTMCERVIYLKKGRIEFDGPTEEGIRRYEDECQLSVVPWMKTAPADWPIVVTGCATLAADGNPRTVFDHGESMRLRISYRCRGELRDPNIIVAFIRSDGVACCNYSSESDGIGAGTLRGDGLIEIATPPLKLVAESYSISILVRAQGSSDLLAAQMGPTFHIRHELFDTHYGVFHEEAGWKFSALASDLAGERGGS